MSARPTKPPFWQPAPTKPKRLRGTHQQLLAAAAATYDDEVIPSASAMGIDRRREGDSSSTQR